MLLFVADERCTTMQRCVDSWFPVLFFFFHSLIRITLSLLALPWGIFRSWTLDEHYQERLASTFINICTSVRMLRCWLVTITLWKALRWYETETYLFDSSQSTLYTWSLKSFSSLPMIALWWGALTSTWSLGECFFSFYHNHAFEILVTG